MMPRAMAASDLNGGSVATSVSSSAVIVGEGASTKPSLIVTMIPLSK